MTPLNGLLSRLGSVVRVIIQRWESVQVELHGSYSIERFTSMQKYCEATSIRRALGVLAITPLPMLICAAVVDAFPLESPSHGFSRSYMLWIRGALAGFIQSYALSWIFCQYVAELQVSRRVLVLISAIAGVAIHLMALLLALLLWYPLPFTVLVVSGPWVFILASALKLSRGSFLRGHPKVLQDVQCFSVIFVSQTSTVLVYTAFNAIFASVPLQWQLGVALIFPVFKITQKNVLRRILFGKDDLKPEMTIFNIEISNAFFISANIQRKASINTSILLVLVDLLQMLLSLCDLGLMIQSVEGIAEKMGVSTTEAANIALTIATRYPELRERSHVTESLTQSKADMWLLSFHQNHTNTSTPKSRPSKAQIAPMPAEKSTVLPRSSCGNQTAAYVPPKEMYAIESGVNTAMVIERITQREQYLLLDKVLQIMFFTEFVLLTEFIEVFMPVMYSIYLVILFYWPNRQFYPQFDGLDEAQFWKNICNTLAYGVLEVGSFALLIGVIYRTTHRHPLQQLAYAITSSWGKIQGKLIIWVILQLQSTILQMGTDYTFKFEWIHKH